MTRSRFVDCVETLERRVLLAAAGENVIVYSDAGQHLQIENPNGTGATTIPTTVPNPDEPTFTPDRTRIVFTGVPSFGADGKSEIYIIGVDGSTETRTWTMVPTSARTAPESSSAPIAT
jgi:hypothetical protein